MYQKPNGLLYSESYLVPKQPKWLRWPHMVDYHSWEKLHIIFWGTFPSIFLVKMRHFLGDVCQSDSLMPCMHGIGPCVHSNALKAKGCSIHFRLSCETSKEIGVTLVFMKTEEPAQWNLWLISSVSLVQISCCENNVHFICLYWLCIYYIHNYEVKILSTSLDKCKLYHSDTYKLLENVKHKCYICKFPIF